MVIGTDVRRMPADTGTKAAPGDYELRLRRRRLPESGPSLFAWVRRSATATVLLDRSGRLLMANASAKRVAARQDSLRIGTDGIHALNARDDATLQELIRNTVAGQIGSHEHGAGAMRLPGQGRARDYLLQINAVEDRRPTSEAGRKVIAVIICDPESPPAINPAVLLDLFGLTSAEFRVVEQFLSGKSPKQVAEHLGIAVATVRYHLLRLYGKTQTHRLSELLTLLQQVAGTALCP